MRRERLTITIDPNLLKKVDALVDNEVIRNRSHAIESVLKKSLGSPVTKAVILAGGSGADFRPLTYEIPVSLIPFKDKCLIEYQIDLIKSAGILDIVICTGPLGEKIVEKYGDGSDFGVNITYSNEENPLGTAGSMNSARKTIGDETFLVLYGDILTDLDLNDFLGFHASDKYITTIALTTKPNPQSYGMVQVKGTDIVKFTEKPTTSKSSYIVNTGMYIMEPEIFDYISDGKVQSLEVDVFPILAGERLLAGYNTDNSWFDISHPESYEQALKEFELTSSASKN